MIAKNKNHFRTSDSTQSIQKQKEKKRFDNKGSANLEGGQRWGGSVTAATLCRAAMAAGRPRWGVQDGSVKGRARDGGKGQRRGKGGGLGGQRRRGRGSQARAGEVAAAT